MVRMLGFSEEDKQRIGFAQHGAGKGVVRGVLGLPGRLVGGMLGGRTTEISSHASENQVSCLFYHHPLQSFVYVPSCTIRKSDIFLFVKMGLQSTNCRGL